MKIILNEIKLLEDTGEGYKTLIDNSYNEWTNNWSNLSKEKIKNAWTAKFEINFNNKVGYFLVDTEGDYLTYMDLEGYLNGEEFPLEDGKTLKLASHSSNILIAIVFSESIRLGLIDEDEASYLSMIIFPEWSRGLVPEDVLEDEDVASFYDETLKYLINKNHLELFKVNLDEYSVISEFDKNITENFVNFVEKYVTDDLFFYTSN